MSRIIITDKGEISLESSSKVYINPSPIGILVCGGIAHKPASAEVCGDTVKVKYPHGECTLLCEDKDGYHKLTLLTAPEDADGFVFGPYETDASDYGDTLGAGWFDDGSAACIQSLMPKVEEGTYVRITENKTGLPLSLGGAASNSGGVVRLHCFAKDRSRVYHDHSFYMDNWQMHNCITGAVEGEDAKIDGASVALIGADSSRELVDIIGRMEIAEGLPHPTYLGNWAKTDNRISSFYLIFDGWTMTNAERIAAAKRAGVSCVYFCDIIGKWGHFTVNKDKFPGGPAEVAQNSDEAYENGIIVGAHSLTNFLHPSDEYVTPVPHERLLVSDITTLAHDIDESAETIYITSEEHYSIHSDLDTFRIDDELIIFKDFDPESLCLSGCRRGAHGTHASSHKAGSEVKRLVDHSYRVFFPDIELQDEVADSLGTLIRDCHVRKMSFDGLEGTTFTGHENYARARFVKRVFDKVGSELICDGSNYSHYLWHAFSYGNWGEPYYEDNHRGGMHIQRMINQEYFKNNLIPHMLGWYQIWSAIDRWEATAPETMEFILSRSAAFDAGAALQMTTWVYHEHGLMDEFLDLISLWGDFRLRADIPDNLRERMQDENSNWHLEKTEDGWKLTEVVIRRNDLAYRDGIVKKEMGYIGDETAQSEDGELIYHSSIVVWDAVYPELGEPEPIHFRIRVGEPGCGAMKSLCLYNSITFDFDAVGGDYLEYKGGDELYHYDKNYNLKALVKGSGNPISISRGQRYLWGKFDYTTDNDPHARYILTEIRNRRVYRICPKQDRA